jgi:hypothetical protein
MMHSLERRGCVEEDVASAQNVLSAFGLGVGDYDGTRGLVYFARQGKACPFSASHTLYDFEHTQYFIILVLWAVKDVREL